MVKSLLDCKEITKLAILNEISTDTEVTKLKLKWKRRAGMKEAKNEGSERQVFYLLN